MADLAKSLVVNSNLADAWANLARLFRVQAEKHLDLYHVLWNSSQEAEREAARLDPCPCSAESHSGQTVRCAARRGHAGNLHVAEVTITREGDGAPARGVYTWRAEP